MSIICVVRVLNVSFEKFIAVRFTTNDWITHNEALASHIPNSCDGWSDKFTVTFSVTAECGSCLKPGQRILFAVKYLAGSNEYWDNNNGLNYSLLYQLDKSM
jgi:protein phosphatase 1 regulatory subunit 3A/B/C/D/E